MLYSPKRVEGKFSEVGLRTNGVLGNSRRAGRQSYKIRKLSDTLLCFTGVCYSRNMKAWSKRSYACIPRGG
jgi:hypothetical protein